MEVVTIDSLAFEAYRSVAQTTTYLAAAQHAGTTWSSATETEQGQALVTMTRILDRQKWKSDYDTQAEREVVADIQNACMEGALALLAGAEFQSTQSTAQQIQSLKAGSVALTYFRGAEGAAHRFPVIVHELLRDYLAGTAATNYGQSTGTSGTSSTADDFGHTRSI